MDDGRYARQTRLPQVGAQGQAKLAQATVVVVGCGALGSHSAELLCRAGVGSLRLIDRDILEPHNLQRQSLYDEQDLADGLPKALAAERRLSRVNAQVRVQGLPLDLSAQTITHALAGADVVVDGTDGFDTRYLLNDWCVSQGVAWCHGACVGWEGRVMTVMPGRSACLRCVFEEPPPPGSSPTCETAGVIGPVAALVGAWQAAEAIRLLLGQPGALEDTLLAVDLWDGAVRRLALRRDAQCPCCARGQLEWLHGDRATEGATLCGRDAVQVSSPSGTARLDLPALSARLAHAGVATPLRVSPHLARMTLHRGGKALQLSLFADGRAIVQGTTDLALARQAVGELLG